MNGGRQAAFPPWLEGHLGPLIRLISSGHTPPGLLVTGPKGVGKGVLVRAFLQRMACTEAAEGLFGCGRCNGCRSFRGGTHPEILQVTPEAPGKEIVVDSIRSVIEFLSLSHGGPARMVFIEPAEAMNVNAANALLKTLEEPPGGAMLLLAAAQPARLPATVRSRCRLLRVPVPERAALRNWLIPFEQDELSADEALAACLDRPLEARALLDDEAAQAAWRSDRTALETLLRSESPFPVIQRFLECDLASLLPRLQRLLVSAQHYLVQGETDAFARLFGTDLLGPFAAGLGMRETALLYQDSLQWQRELQAPLNPNLRCEDIVLRFWRRVGPS
ncbi:MAG: DNA-directed DNA polymerase [Thioalkalivibrio sp.]|nr:MAG: DNA-directed DNA polymerase [Thioalkalivibrio sp.]